MSLSNDLLSQFAKLTNDKTTKTTETTVYGTIKSDGDSLYVQLDGSELLTPVETTTSYKVGERVAVQIKNHTATVTGNLSSPSARNADVVEVNNKVIEAKEVIAEILKADILTVEKATIDELIADNVDIHGTLTAQNGKIANLEADYVTINGTLTAQSGKIETLESDSVKINESLEAANAIIYNLEGTYAKFTDLEARDAEINNLKTNKLSATDADLKYATIGNLNAAVGRIDTLESDYVKTSTLEANYATIESLDAAEAHISTLETTKLSAEDAELTYANINFSNIKMAAVEELFTKSGIIKDLVVGDQSITGELVGVTIKGDLIEANTLKADRLFIQGEDGLYYKLNVNSLGETTASSDDKYQNGLDGSVIIAESITANKIRVEDLVAFDATIGGFHITDSSLYSNVKESIDNTTKGIYMDSNGQFSVGDSKNYLKFYEDTDGNYIFETSYMKSTDDGLVIGNLAEATLRGNVLIDDDSVDIRIGDKVLASYEGKNIYLGKNSADAVIDLCDGTGQIKHDSPYGDEWHALNIESNGIIQLNSVYETVFRSSTSFFTPYDGSEHICSSYMNLCSSPTWAGSSLQISRGILISDSCTTLSYGDGSSTQTSSSSGNIRMLNYELNSELRLSASCEYEDYSDIAKIDMLGSHSRNADDSKYSLIRLNADTIHLQGARVLVGPRNADIGSYNVCDILLASPDDNDYYGMVTPKGNYAGWIRTTKSGLIPYEQDSSNGSSSLGSESWPFANTYTANLHTLNVYGFEDSDGNYRRITFNDSTVIDGDGDIILPNATGIHSYNVPKEGATAATRSLIYLSGNNNTNVGYGGYSKSEGETGIYGNKVMIYSKTAGASFKPYYEKSDSISTVWWVAGFVPATTTNLHFTIPLAKPVIGSPKITVTSNSGKLTVRQEGTFIFGSSDGASPNSYSASLTAGGNAIKITAKFGNSTNVTKNCPCFVSADIKIAFS